MSAIDLVFAAFRVIDSAGLVIALVLMASIFAAIGGLVSWRLRVYGAMVGAMVVNIVAKAEGASYEAAFAAMVAVTVLATVLGSAGLIVNLMKIKRA